MNKDSKLEEFEFCRPPEADLAICILRDDLKIDEQNMWVIIDYIIHLECMIEDLANGGRDDGEPPFSKPPDDQDQETER